MDREGDLHQAQHDAHRSTSGDDGDTYHQPSSPSPLRAWMKAGYCRVKPDLHPYTKDVFRSEETMTPSLRQGQASMRFDKLTVQPRHKLSNQK